MWPQLDVLHFMEITRERFRGNGYAANCELSVSRGDVGPDEPFPCCHPKHGSSLRQHMIVENVELDTLEETGASIENIRNVI